MAFMLALVSLVGILIQGLSSQSQVDNGQIWITPKNNQTTKDKSLGVVYGTRSCGGPGHFLQMRFEGCRTTKSICRLPADSHVRRSEMDFVPSTDITQLGFQIFLAVEGSSFPMKVYDRILRNNSVVGGTPQTIYIQGSDHAMLRSTPGKGSLITRRRNVTKAQYVLYRVDNGSTEICAEADFKIV